jgi:hypothetical protein
MVEMFLSQEVVPDHRLLRPLEYIEAVVYGTVAEMLQCLFHAHRAGPGHSQGEYLN